MAYASLSRVCVSMRCALPAAPTRQYCCAKCALATMPLLLAQHGASCRRRFRSEHRARPCLGGPMSDDAFASQLRRIATMVEQLAQTALHHEQIRHATP